MFGPPMRAALLSTFELPGGAARAAVRLLDGLCARGVDATLHVQKRNSDHPGVVGPATPGEKAGARLRPLLDKLPLELRRTTPRGLFSPAWVGGGLPSGARRRKPDIVNLHWVAQGFVSIPDVRRLSIPLVWTLHDMWAFTGGCHYDLGCEGYTARCGRCPVLGSRHAWDLSRWTWRRKRRQWENVDLTVVTPSRWLSSCAARSSLFSGLRIETIPYGVDLSRFRPVPKAVAREILQLPLDRRIVLFGAIDATRDERKGVRYLQQALPLLADGPHGPIAAAIFGASGPAKQSAEPIAVHYLGHLHDEVTIALAYAAADVFVAPSLQDNLPNTVLESLACGTPVVAFRVGGMPDLVDSGANGYLAEPFDPADLARGIAWVLEDEERHRALRDAARRKAETEFHPDFQTGRYQSLYEEVVERARRKNRGPEGRVT
jgi:glycosyltransferase involved in cell wall biosynthesis